jgi:hypothetical protein
MAPYKTSRRRGSLGGQVMSFEGSVNMVLSVGTSAIDLLYYYSLLSFTYLHVLSLCSVQRQQRKQYHYPQSPAHPDGIPHAHIFSQALRRLHRCQRSSIPKRFNRDRSCYSIAQKVPRRAIPSGTGRLSAYLDGPVLLRIGYFVLVSERSESH